MIIQKFKDRKSELKELDEVLNSNNEKRKEGYVC